MPNYDTILDTILNETTDQQVVVVFAAVKEAMEHPTEESFRSASTLLDDMSHAFTFASGYIAAMNEAKDMALSVAAGFGKTAESDNNGPLAHGSQN